MTTRKAGAADKGRVTVDINDLTVDEIEVVEDYIDAPIQSVLDPESRQAKSTRALAYVFAKRTDPDVTLESVGSYRVFFKTSEVPPTDESGS